MCRCGRLEVLHILLHRGNTETSVSGLVSIRHWMYKGVGAVQLRYYSEKHGINKYGNEN